MNKKIEELRDLNLELEGLNAKKNALKKQLQEHRDEFTDEILNNNIAEAKELRAKINQVKTKIKELGENNMEIKNDDVIEARAKEFASTNRMVIPAKEARSVLVSSGTIATPTEVKGINNLWNQVSSIVDQVTVVDCQGMGANKVAYVKSIATADETAEGADYNESDPEFGFVTIEPTTITTISYISKQTRKQSPLQYEAKVRESALSALRIKAGSLIVDKILASDLVADVNASAETPQTAIDATTLRKIATNYGGNENVVGNAVLYLCKADLIKFGDVRGKNEYQAIYEITPNTENPNIGTIKDKGLVVSYTINSKLPEGTMIYGQPKNSELDLFSNYEIEVSDDFKFNQGLLAIRGDAQIGTDVVVQDGFIKYILVTA